MGSPTRSTFGREPCLVFLLRCVLGGRRVPISRSTSLTVLQSVGRKSSARQNFLPAPTNRGLPRFVAAPGSRATRGYRSDVRFGSKADIAAAPPRKASFG